MRCIVPTRLSATTGAALLGTDAQLLHQEYRRVLAPVAGEPLQGARQLGFRVLVYFELIGSLGEQGLQLSPAQKQEVFQVLVRKLRSTSSSNWLRDSLSIALVASLTKIIIAAIAVLNAMRSMSPPTL